MAENELKPCPHCGGDDIRINAHQHAGRNGETVYSMCCYQCGATFPSRYKRQLLVDAWNRRTPDPIREEMALALQRIIDKDQYYRSPPDDKYVDGPFAEIARAALSKHRSEQVQKLHKFDDHPPDHRSGK